ncbi:MAG: GNAT family N-acetyltransferase [Planctomycetota bacterium]
MPPSPPSSQDAPHIRAASSADLECVYAFLEPFFREKILLRRSQSELAILLPTGFIASTQDAEDSEQVVGFCSVEIYSKKLSEIQCLAVHQEFRRHGVGGQLVDRCVNLAKERGVMEVMAISSSESFLQNHGFDYSLPQQKRALFYQIRNRFDD